MILDKVIKSMKENKHRDDDFVKSIILDNLKDHMDFTYICILYIFI